MKLTLDRDVIERLDYSAAITAEIEHPRQNVPSRILETSLRGRESSLRTFLIGNLR